MSLLLLDLGNTRLKWAFSDNEAPFTMHSLVCSDEPDQWQPLWQAIAALNTSLSSVALSSVAGALGDELARALAARTGLVVHRVQSPAMFGAWQSAYAEPDKLGVDRFLAMLAASHRYRHCVVVMLGTATTLDVVINDQHLGGLILPGISLMRKSLARNTARLPDVSEAQEESSFALANNTHAAIRNASLRATVALIQDVLRSQVGATLILSGGAANSVADALEENSPQMWPTLVLDGLKIWQKQRFPD